MKQVEERYISLLTDFGFKRIFGTAMNKDLLICFLNSLFNGKQVVKDVSYLNPEHVGDVYTDRRAIFDVYCEGENGEKFIVEMQNAYQTYFKDRALFYSTFPIREQAPKGSEWDFRLNHVYTVALLNFSMNEDAFDKESEPDIYGAITRDALLENVTVAKDGKIDFADKTVTENTRVSYPIYHIKNIQRPFSQGPAAKQVIFLSADAFGVLPPVSILNAEQTKYYFLSGFTAKLAGTERGITEPTPTFSACFGQAFLELHPTKYAEELVKKMQKSGAKAYLVNTGWNGTGKRISIRDTRGIIDAILDHSIDAAPTKTIPFFNFVVPTQLEGVDPKILDPRDTYAEASQWEEKAKDLAARFIKNFKKYETNEAGKALVAAGPQL